MSNTLISVKNLSVDYITDTIPIRAVRDVSFEISSGEIFGLVGESGSGKSTVVQAMMRILAPPAFISSGKVIIDSENINSVHDISSGGIILSGSAKEKPSQGEVVAVGPGKVSNSGDTVSMNVSVGDIVIFGQYGGNEIKLDGEEYLILSEKDIFGVVE